MTAEELIAQGKAEFGHSFVTAIAARLRVSDRHVTAWVEGRIEIPPRHVETLERLFRDRAAARELVARFMGALRTRAAEAGIESADIAAALAADIDVRLACIDLRDAGRQRLGRDR